MKKILGILIIIATIILGAYVGIWVMLVGGIIQIVNSINPVNGMGIAIGIIKILFCEIAGLIPYIGVIVGNLLIMKD